MVTGGRKWKDTLCSGSGKMTLDLFNQQTYLLRQETNNSDNRTETVFTSCQAGPSAGEQCQVKFLTVALGKHWNILDVKKRSGSLDPLVRGGVSLLGEELQDLMCCDHSPRNAFLKQHFELAWRKVCGGSRKQTEVCVA